MKKEFIKAVTNGRVIKTNTFDGDFGKYTIDIVVHNDTFYFYKSKNGKIVECIDLNELARKEKNHVIKR